MPTNDEHAAKIEAFFAKKNVSEICPMCRTNRWEISEHEPFSRVYLEGDSPADERMSTRYFLTYALYCQNCGFVAHHMKHVVDGSEESAEVGSSDERS